MEVRSQAARPRPRPSSGALQRPPADEPVPGWLSLESPWRSVACPSMLVWSMLLGQCQHHVPCPWGWHMAICPRAGALRAVC